MHEPLHVILPERLDERAQGILREMSGRNLKLATAESGTGGLLASLLSDAPEMSQIFERGFVASTPAAKIEMLGVDPRILTPHGEVSEAVARAMAEGALERSSADLALAVTGYTEGAPGRPPGLVHVACVRWSRPTMHRSLEVGPVGRARVRIAALDAALALLAEQLTGRPGETLRREAPAEGSRSWIVPKSVRRQPRDEKGDGLR